MKISFGRSMHNGSANQPVLWDSAAAVNGHMIVVGQSGAGKTTLIRRIAAEIASQTSTGRLHIIDVHGDLEVPHTSSMMFSETSPFGINPLRISSHPHFGGPRKKARSFIRMLNRTSTRLGQRQQAVLARVLDELYERNGILYNRPDTWDVPIPPTRQHRMPALPDLVRYTQAKLERMITGTSGPAHHALTELNKSFRSLKNTAKDLMKGNPDTGKLAGAKARVLEQFAEYVESIETGHELRDFVLYDDSDILRSIMDRLYNLERSGIFKPNPPTFDPDLPIWRYDIRALQDDEQKMFVDVLIEAIFSSAREDGLRRDPNVFIVLDEIHKFTSDDNDHILNIVAKEGRKFGVSLIGASQSFDHFSTDFISNSATKVILGIDAMFQGSSAKKLGIDPYRLQNIRVAKTGIVQIKHRNDVGNHFIDVALSQ